MCEKRSPWKCASGSHHQAAAECRVDAVTTHTRASQRRSCVCGIKLCVRECCLPHRPCSLKWMAGTIIRHASCGGHRQFNRHRHTRPYRRCMRNPKPRNNFLYHITGGQAFQISQSTWPRAGSHPHRLRLRLRLRCSGFTRMGPSLCNLAKREKSSGSYPFI